jgi:glycerol-3-phosphate cytidylyltransferase
MLFPRNKRIGFIASSFDLGPHAGHVATLAEAKEHCEYLVVALHVNPQSERDFKNKPLPSVSERFLILMANKFVDQIIPYETEQELINLLHFVQPQVRFLGEDYMHKDFTGKGISGIDIIFCHRKHDVSSSGLRKKIRGEA